LRGELGQQCEVGKLKAEEEEKHLLVRIGEGAVSLMFWNF